MSPDGGGPIKAASGKIHCTDPTAEGWHTPAPDRFFLLAQIHAMSEPSKKKRRVEASEEEVEASKEEVEVSKEEVEASKKPERKIIDFIEEYDHDYYKTMVVESIAKSFGSGRVDNIASEIDYETPEKLQEACKMIDEYKGVMKDAQSLFDHNKVEDDPDTSRRELETTAICYLVRNMTPEQRARVMAEAMTIVDDVNRKIQCDDAV